MAPVVPGRGPCVAHTQCSRAQAGTGRSRVLRRCGLHSHTRNRRAPVAVRAADSAPEAQVVKQEGASTDLKLIAQRTLKLIRPYWITNPDANKPRLALAGVVALSLATTGVSVVFSFLGRDFFNALSQKDEAQFYAQLAKYLGGFAVGIPVFVFRDYFVATLSLRWRAWMTEDMLGAYMADRTFYNISTGAVIDNPDQRLTTDINNFTSTSLSLAFTFLTSLVDLVSFSGILFSIYPPLFGALLVYAIGGTALSFVIGKRLVGLNFRQEAREADFRYGLVRVRENAESVAFYRGASSEVGLLVGRLGRVVANYGDLIKASRNLDFFQSAYRYIIILLPAAVVAPLFFRGEIEFGVVNQSQSAFSHILSDVSLVVYQFESLASFSAVVDRLGEFQETVEARGKFAAEGAEAPAEVAANVPFGAEIAEGTPSGDALVSVRNATLCTPNYARALVRDLTVDVPRGGRLLVMGPSGCGKTSMLRAIGGLWKAGEGEIATPPVTTPSASGPAGGMMFVPQRPYMVLGSLRQQLLYPAYSTAIIAEAVESYDDAGAGNPLDPASKPQVLSEAEVAAGSNGSGTTGDIVAAVAPRDDVLEDALHKVGLDELLERCAVVSGGDPWGMVADWATLLSLGEQQRLAMARVLLANPSLVLLDESTSALDLENEARLYKLLIERGVAIVSVGHRDSLRQYHDRVLRLEGGAAAGWRLEECTAEPAAVAGVQ